MAALKRARLNDAGLVPGQSVSYVVVDGGAGGAQQVRLAFETLAEYDMGWYEQETIWIVESVLFHLDWHRDAIKQNLVTTEDACLANY